MASLRIDSAYLLERKLRQWPIIKRAAITFVPHASRIFLFALELTVGTEERSDRQVTSASFAGKSDHFSFFPRLLILP